ncbi:MAG: DUF4276 family protein [Candidatus Methylacidiphilales bacterium]|nr:DUF4276 family protein [Candidatus Methylacidiphilales bacterium]
MHRVLVVVEGQTEKLILESVFAPYLILKNIDLRARIVGVTGHKGGDTDFNRVSNDIIRLLNQEPGSTISTFFDYYGLHPNWPGFTKSNSYQLASSIVQNIETKTLEAIKNKSKLDLSPNRFIPYIQLHELEALFFADPIQLARAFESPSKATAIQQLVDESGGCEVINNGFDTHPAKRLEGFFPRYRKGAGIRSDASFIAEAVGVDQMRACCPRFDSWITRLELLGL